MVAIIVEEDQHSRSVLSKMLAGKRGLGYADALVATDINEAKYLIRQNLDRVELILAAGGGYGMVDGLEMPIVRAVEREPGLERAPLILMSSWRFPGSIRRIRSRYSRIDDFLPRPFGMADLRASILRSHRARAARRSTLLVVGQEAASGLAEAFYACRHLVHWKEVVALQSESELAEMLENDRFRVGGIIVDPCVCDRRMIECISRFRKSPNGKSTALAILSRNRKEVGELRPHGELFFERTEAIDSTRWEEIVTLLSRRALLHRDAFEVVSKGRMFLKEGKLAQAASWAKHGLSTDPDRWEFQELAGAVSLALGFRGEAIEYFKYALNMNPFSPYSYIALLKILTGVERDRVLTEAAFYCTDHPQLRELAKPQALRTVHA